jgi:hypothetical protein
MGEDVVRRVARTARKHWTKPQVRRIAGGSAEFGAEGQEDGDGFS